MNNCGTCLYHKKDYESEWYCNNPDSECYMCDTAWGDSCLDYEERD